MSIAERIGEIKAQLPQQTRLVAVSKYHPEEAIKEAYDAGQRIFGESHVQELVAKHEHLPQDIEWHFIGHLQTNKVKYIAPFVSLIHSVDTTHLLAEIEKQAQKAGRVIPVLLEVHVAVEETKFGFTPAMVTDLLKGNVAEAYPHICFAGLMGMASHTDDQSEISREFHLLASLFNSCKAVMPTFRELSMGMSGDFRIAVQEGSTLVRVGTYIFGERDYSQH